MSDFFIRLKRSSLLNYGAKKFYQISYEVAPGEQFLYFNRQIWGLHNKTFYDRNWNSIVVSYYVFRCHLHPRADYHMGLHLCKFKSTK